MVNSQRELKKKGDNNVWTVLPMFFAQNSVVSTIFYLEEEIL